MGMDNVFYTHELWPDDRRPPGLLKTPGKPKLAVVVPTVTGREGHFGRCIDAYLRTLRDAGMIEGVDWTFRVFENLPTCGLAWDEAARLEEWADVLHFTADDLEPQPGWWQSAERALRFGILPSPVIHNGHTGALEFGGTWATLVPEWNPVPMTVIPTVTVEAWRAGAPLAVDAMSAVPSGTPENPRLRLEAWTALGQHYFSDNAVSSCARAAGWRIQPRHAYSFVHWWADEGRQPMQGPAWHQAHAGWLDLHNRLGLA